MSDPKDWKHYWETRAEKASSDFNFDRGITPRKEEIDRLAEAELIRFIDPQPNETLVDAGCGTGANMLMLHSKVRRVIGMDFSEGAVERCRRRIESEHITNAEVSSGTIAQIPLPDSSVDKVICLSVLQYLDDTEMNAALSEFARVLVAAGTVVLHVKNLSSLYLSTLRAAKWVKKLGGKQPKMEYIRTFGSYVTALNSHGFDVVDYNSFNFLVVDKMPKCLLMFMQRFELRHHNSRLLRLGLVRRHGSDLKIKAIRVTHPHSRVQ